MINQAGTDQLDDAIDCFEQNWSPGPPRRVREVLDRFGLSDDAEAATELIRIDIELRYDRGLTIDLQHYFEEFESLLSQPQHVAEIAFEDFRSRTAYGQPLTLSRWKSLPGVSSQRWYRQIDEEAERAGRSAGRRPTDPDSQRLQLCAAESELTQALRDVGFQLIQQIGQGAFSQVYLATQNDLANRYVVLKVVEQPLSEPEKMATLQHTNIVPIYSFHRVLSRSVICMPYAGVVTLADFLAGESAADTRGGASLVTTVLANLDETVIDRPQRDSESMVEADPVPSVENSGVLEPLSHFRELDCCQLAVWIFERLAAALAHSHARGVMHGDLKPANVLIRNDGEPALLDFNLSHRLDQPNLRHIGGTLPYMSPESYRGLMGQAVAIDQRSDIYALGVMLYQFVTGRLPFASPRSAAAIDLEPALAARKTALGWEPADAVTAGLKSIIERCLADEVMDRYRSAEQLQEDLQRERDHRSLRFAAEPAVCRLKKWIRRHPRLVSSSSVAAVLLTLLVPLAGLAGVAHRRAAQLAAESKVERFADQSSAALSASVADVTQLHRTDIQALLEPLEEFSLLNDVQRQEIFRSLPDQQVRAGFRDLLYKHIMHAAIVETGRLRAKYDAPVEPDQLGRVDRLIREAAAVRPDGETSRAWTRLLADRATLIGDPQAAPLLRRASELPFDSDTERYLGALELMTRHRYDNARVLLLQIRERGSVPPPLRWTALGRTQLSVGNYEDAKLSFTRSLEYAPDSPQLYYFRGLCHYRSRQYRLAIGDFTKAVEHDPRLMMAYCERGLCRQSLQQHDQALQDYNTALELSPDHVHALIFRSRVLRKLGRPQDAARDWKRVIEATDLSLTELTTRARAYTKRGNFKAAREDLEKALAMDRTDPVVYFQMARVLAELGEVAAAIEQLDRVLAIYPRDGTRMDRAVLLARLGRDDEAIEDLESAMKPPNSPLELYQAACAHALLSQRQRGDRDKAFRYLSQSLFAGFEPDQSLTEDPDLEPLRDDERWDVLLKSLQLANDKSETERDESLSGLDLKPQPVP